MPKIIEGFADGLAVPPGKREILVFDSGHRDAVPGFGIRKFASGAAVFVVKYAHGGRQRRQSLGPVTRGNLKDMRLLASRVKAHARLGQDIIAEKVATQTAQANCRTLGSVIPEFLASRRGSLRPRYFDEVTRHLQVQWQPLHGTDIKAITRSDVVAVIDALERDSGRVAADRARASLSGLFAWAIDRGLAETTPVLHIRARSTAKGRKRVLTEAELREVWHACRDDDYGRIVRLLMLSGQRKTEIGDLAWSEVNLGERQIELPGERTKNHQAHIVPLSDAALALLPVRREDRELLFGRRDGGFSGWSKAKAELDARIAAARKASGERKPMPPWVLHDLRRSFVTHVSQLGFAPPHVVEAIVNHVSGHRAGVAGIYNHATYATEGRQAMEAWARQLSDLVK